MSDVVVYTTEPCSYCTRVKMLLQAREIDFREVNLAGDQPAIQALAERTGMMTLPQVVIDGTLVGGFMETVDADQSGRLQKLLAT